MDASPQPPDGGRPARATRLALAGLTALHVTLMLAFSLLLPAFSGFDETQHVDAVLSIRHGDGWPAPQERELSEGVVQAATPVLRELEEPPFAADEVRPRGDRPSFASLGVERDSTGQPLPNQITQHPPLYYALGAGVLAALPGSADWPYDRTVAALRLLSVALMAPLPLLAWATARALGADRTVALSAAALSLTAPQLQRVGGSVNNDALYATTFAATVLLLVHVASGDLRRRTACATGVAAGLALLSKGFALALPLAVVLSFAVAARRTRGRAAVRPALVSLVAAFAVGGWWWLRNLLVHGTLQPSGWPEDRYHEVAGLVPRSPDEPVSLLAFARGTFSRLSERYWGGLEIGYVGPDTFPVELTTALTLGTAAAVVVALLRRGPLRPGLVVAVLLPFALVLAVVVLGMWRSYQRFGEYTGAQGRYLFGSLPGLSAATALGAAAVAGRARRALLPIAVVAALVLHARGLFRVLDLYWRADAPASRDTGAAWEALLAWSPWPGPVTTAVLVAPAVAAALVLTATVRALREDGGV